MYTEQQIETYLKRIHYKGKLSVSKDTLDALVYAHQCGIPFENLDVYDFYREIPLDEDSLFEKLVMRKRGGYCFETNGLFCRILQSIGFDARPCLCRVMFGLQNPQENFIDHRATIVSLDGRRYFCEAGIGGAMPPGALQLPGKAGRFEGSGHLKLPGVGNMPDADEQPTDCLEGCWQEMQGEFFCVRTIERNWYGTIRRVNVNQDIYDDPMNRKERLEVMFCDAAAHEIDFVTPNYFLSRSDQSMFRQKRVVNLRTPDGYRALTNRTYREVIHGKRTERELFYEEIPIVLKEQFGIEISEELRQDL